MRAFVEVGLPAEVIAALGAVQEGLCSRVGRLPIRWARPEGVHLTLQFLGDVPEGAIAPLGETLRAACEPAAPFSLCLGELGVFPSAARARVVWVGLTGELGGLDAVREAVVDATAPWVAPQEARAFVPHLTLGRVREARREELALLEEAIAAVTVAPVSWRAESVRLMRSILRPSGAEHVALETYRLKGG